MNIKCALVKVLSQILSTDSDYLDILILDGGDIRSVQEESMSLQNCLNCSQNISCEKRKCFNMSGGYVCVYHVWITGTSA